MQLVSPDHGKGLKRRYESQKTREADRQPSARIPLSASRPPCRVPRTILFVLTVPISVPRELASPSPASEADDEVVNSAAESPALLVFGNHVRGWIPGSRDRKSTRLNSSHITISYAVFCLKKKTQLNVAH